MQSVSYLIILLMVAVRFPDGYCWYFLLHLFTHHKKYLVKEFH